MWFIEIELYPDTRVVSASRSFMMMGLDIKMNINFKYGS